MGNLKRFLLQNLAVWAWLVLAVIIELVAQVYVDAKPYIASFWMPMVLAFMGLGFLLCLPGIKSKNIFVIVFLFIQVILVLAGNFLYNANGSAFQKEMFSQRSDAWGALEKWFLFDVGLFIFAWVMFAAFMTFAIVHIVLNKRFALKGMPKYKPAKKIRFTALGLFVVCLAVFCVLPIVDGAREKRQTSYHYLLTSNMGDANQMRGISSNFLYEVMKLGASSGVSLKDMDKVKRFVDDSEPCDTSEFFETSKGNNLVMILAESLDWHVLERYDENTTRELFPTLMEFMYGGDNFGSGVTMTNFRNKEKTDTAEMISMLGNYPTKQYINYDFYKNEYPFSIANMLREDFGGSDSQMGWFHNSTRKAYNRGKMAGNMGFDAFYGIEDMVKEGMEQTYFINIKKGAMTTRRGERNVDSMAVDVMKDYMFPQLDNGQFFTYFTTYVMHGNYEERNSLAKRDYYKKLDDNKVFPKGNKRDNDWRTYAAATMDFDESLRIMMEDLERKKLLDNTTIVIFSDHETYYTDLARYAKSYPEMPNRMKGKYDPELYRIPFIIWDKKLTKKIDDHLIFTRTIDKFTTHADIVPTLLDLFGVEGKKNLYLGSSIFDDTEESIVYSRVYRYFLNDRFLFYNLNDLLYKESGADVSEFEANAKRHLDKLYYIDKIYFSNYFRNNV